MRRVVAFLCVMAMAVACAACSAASPLSMQSPQQSPEQSQVPRRADAALPALPAPPALEVVAAFAPLAEVARAVGGDLVRVVDLTPPGAEPHDLELRPSQRAELDDARVIVELGDGFQPGVEQVAHERARTHAAIVVDALDGQSLRHGADGVDPHVWLDPSRMRRIGVAVADAFVRAGADPGQIERNRARYDAELAALDARYRMVLSACARRSFITSHAAFGYLADAYGLRQVAVEGLAPEGEPTPGRIDDVVRLARHEAATTVFFEDTVSHRLAATLARAAGGLRTATLSPIETLSPAQRRAGETYVTRMDANLVALAQALGCTPPTAIGSGA